MLHKLLSKDERTIALEIASQAAATVQGAATTGNGTQSILNADGTRSVSGPNLTEINGSTVTTATHVGDVTPPGVPTGISATSTSGMLTVRWDGTLTGGVPGDFSHVSVYIDGEGSKSLLGSLSRAGDLTAAGLTEGKTYQVTATAEDDACLADGTPAHNVSAATTSIDVTIAASGGTDDEARRLAQEALDSATATSQFFWSDDSGAHVSTDADNAAGASNVLINALGILLRAAQNNLIGVTPSGITIYDGKGNAASNVVATFSGSEITLGKNPYASTIRMCNDALTISAADKESPGDPRKSRISGEVLLLSGNNQAAMSVEVDDEISPRSMVACDVTGEISLYGKSLKVSGSEAGGSSASIPLSRLATMLSDTGWVSLHEASAEFVRYRACAGVCHLQWDLTYGADSGEWNTTSQIPSGYLPAQSAYVFGESLSSGLAAYAWVSSAGSATYGGRVYFERRSGRTVGSGSWTY